MSKLKAFSIEREDKQTVVTTKNMTAWVGEDTNWMTGTSDVNVTIRDRSGDVVISYADIARLSELTDLLQKVVAVASKMK